MSPAFATFLWAFGFGIYPAFDFIECSELQTQDRDEEERKKKNQEKEEWKRRKREEDLHLMI